MIRGLFRLTQGSQNFKGRLQAIIVAGFIGVLTLGMAGCDDNDGEGAEDVNDSGPGDKIVEKEYCFPLTCEDYLVSQRNAGECSWGLCERDDDCPTGMNCEETVCMVPPCVRDDECDRGLVCDDDVCQPPPCKSDADCSGDDICERERCRPAPCKDDTDCSSDEICDDDSGVCIDPPCTEDDDCDSGWVCNNGRGYCELPACTEDKDCPTELCFTASEVN